MYYITYNDVITPHPYFTKEEAAAELKKTFPDIELDKFDTAVWPSTSTHGRTKIEIKKYEGELE